MLKKETKETTDKNKNAAFPSEGQRRSERSDKGEGGAGFTCTAIH
jgi:hypothetical protein